MRQGTYCADAAVKKGLDSKNIKCFNTDYLPTCKIRCMSVNAKMQVTISFFNFKFYTDYLIIINTVTQWMNVPLTALYGI